MTTDNSLELNSNALTVAARDGDLEAVRRLLPISDPSVYDYLPVTWAARYGYTEILQELIPVSQIERPGALASLMLWTAFEGHTECLNVLTPYTATIEVDLNAVFKQAAIYGRVGILETLVPLVDPKYNHSQALTYAVMHRKSEAVEFLRPLSDIEGIDATQVLLEMVEKRDEAGVKALIPLSNPRHNDSEALFVAINNHFDAGVRLLAPVSDVGSQNSRALVAALNKASNDIAELLYEGSDLRAVWDQLKKDYYSFEDKQKYYPRLYELMTVREQQQMLEQIALEAQAEKRVEQWRNTTRSATDVGVSEQFADEPKCRKM